MPAEVISLLSSSPVGPSTGVIAASLESAKRSDARMPCRPLGYGKQNPANADAGRNGTNSAAGTSRAPSYQALDGGRKGYSGYGAQESLFVSDDFDTTVDLDASFYNNPRASPGFSPRREKRDYSASFKKRELASTRSSHRDSLQPMDIERRNRIADDIEFSSSPANPALPGGAEKAPAISSDPFASSQEKYMSTSHKPTPANSSYSLPKGHDKSGRDTTRCRSAGGDRKAQLSSKATFIDLSSDPPDSPPQPKPLSTSSNARVKATWDPISSSAPDTYDIQDLLASPSTAPTAMPCSQTRATTVDGSSDSDDLPDLNDVDPSTLRATKYSNYSSSRPTKRTMRKPSQCTEGKERGNRQKIEVREAEREYKRVEKVHAREERARQKEEERALAEVNKLRTDKKVSTPEMIVDIPTRISPELKVQLEAFLGDLNVQYETWDSTVEHVVKWRRKVTSWFDEEMGVWKPTPMRIQDEHHVLVIVHADEFVKFVLGEEGEDLEAHVLQMKSKFPNAKLVYLIEGLTTWMRKNRDLLNRQFASAVRNIGADADSDPSSIQPRRRNSNQVQEYIDEDKLEDALLSLQVLHGTLVHHTHAPVETAQWVAIFTQHISTIPYRRARDASADAGFCMESGQVSTGDNTKDTFLHMLQAITRVTSPIAYGIVAKYESMTDLIQGLEEEGPLALAECRKGASKDGALTDRTIGQAISKRIHKIFLGQDPTSTDV
ncbi:putative ercc4 domain-containing protein [Rosellinia necatrix]|uniref:Putative ercc4 domain-containing protein n=1 Tax=Rosellinia necatrix TaxID=77044 RepID=A0A1W2TI94_ROSNE|nr:putative ercc4 domain-containing protein [Rosellinia necatrix]